jgi:hypothetical protein
MERLLNICKTRLSRADLDISVEFSSGAILLNFLVVDSLERIVFRCSEYAYLEITKSPENDECFFVSETQIEVVRPRRSQNGPGKDYWTPLQTKEEINNSKYKPMIRVTCGGDATLNIVCHILSWKIDDDDFQEVTAGAIAPFVLP